MLCLRLPHFGDRGGAQKQTTPPGPAGDSMREGVRVNREDGRSYRVDAIASRPVFRQLLDDATKAGSMLSSAIRWTGGPATSGSCGVMVLKVEDCVRRVGIQV